MICLVVRENQVRRSNPVDPGTRGSGAISISILDASMMIYHRSGSARGLRPGTPTKQKGQRKPRQKSADVRHVSDATRLRCVGNGTDAAKPLPAKAGRLLYD